MGGVEDLYPYLHGIATNLSSTLMEAAGRRVRDEALGDDQERALNNVFGGATSVVLVEMARRAPDDTELPDRLGKKFAKFYGDPWTAETLVGAALTDEQPPSEKLCRRFGELGLEPGELPMGFGEAMLLLTREVSGRIRREASRAGSPLNNMVEVSELGIIRAEVEGVREEIRGLADERGAARAPAGSAGGRVEADGERFAGYEAGPDDAFFDVLFAGFFLPSGPEGRLTHGGASRAFERRFLEVLRAEVDGHRLNTSGIAAEDLGLPLRVLDHRPPVGYAAGLDHEGFSETSKLLAERTLGVVWGTMREGGGLETLEVVVNPERFHGGPAALAVLTGVKRLADRAELSSPARADFAARALAAVWAQSFCAELDRRGMHAEAYAVAADSRRLIERALEELGRALGPGEQAAVEGQRRGLLPQTIRQEASSLWQQGELKAALSRLLDALKISPHAPLSGRGEYREYCEARYAFEVAQRYERFDRYVAENYAEAPALRRDVAWQYARRALAGLPPVDLSLFSTWIQEAVRRGVDVEEDAERWLSELAAVHPEDPFVIAEWGEARRVIAVGKYGAVVGSADSWRMDGAAERFGEAYRMAPGVPYFAARAQAISFTASFAYHGTKEGERRFDESLGWWGKAKPYYREHAPWMLEPGPLDEPERLARWVNESKGGKDEH